MFESSKAEAATKAREELGECLANLGAVVAENAKITTKEVIADVAEVVSSSVKTTFDQIDPRAFIRQNPLKSLAGAFVTGLLLASRRGSIQRLPGHPVLGVVTALGVDLLRAYAMSRIDRGFGAKDERPEQ